MTDMDEVFHALAHENRRTILDFIKINPAANTGDICQLFTHSRAAVIKHIQILEKANLLVIEKEGRYRLHYFNSLPIQAIYDRWTDEYSQFFAKRMHQFKQQLEDKFTLDSNSQQDTDDEKTA